MCGRAIEFVGKRVNGNSERLDSSKIVLNASLLYTKVIPTERASYYQDDKSSEERAHLSVAGVQLSRY